MIKNKFEGLPSLMPGTMFCALTRWIANFVASYTWISSVGKKRKVRSIPFFQYVTFMGVVSIDDVTYLYVESRRRNPPSAGSSS